MEKIEINGLLYSEDYTKNPTTVVVGNMVEVGKAKFAGKFDQANLGMYITKVLYNDPATVIFWSDGTKTISKVQKGDTYNKELGLTLCVLKKLVGSSQVVSLLNEWIDEKSNYVDLKLIRAKKKEINKVKVEEVKIEEPTKKETPKKTTTSTTTKKKTSSSTTKVKKEESTQQ
jgi:hypothetical protein